MALDLDVATSTLSRIEQEKRMPSLEMLERIASRLGVRLSNIFLAAEDDEAIFSPPPDQNTAARVNDSPEETQLQEVMREFSPRNKRLLTEFAKLLKNEWGD